MNANKGFLENLEIFAPRTRLNLFHIEQLVYITEKCHSFFKFKC